MWETEAVKLLTDEQGRMCGVKVRKSDGLFNDVLGNNVMLACGGFDGNPEMLAKVYGNRTVDLPPIAPGLVYNSGASLNI
jgi:succinate dehydrogenase/fumarate reductase flavoprotein subunit